MDTVQIDPVQLAKGYPDNVGRALVYLLLSNRFGNPGEALGLAHEAIGAEMGRLGGKPAPSPVELPRPLRPQPSKPVPSPAEPQPDRPQIPTGKPNILEYGGGVQTLTVPATVIVAGKDVPATVPVEIQPQIGMPYQW